MASAAHTRDGGAFGSCDTNFNPQAVGATATADGGAIDLRNVDLRNGTFLAAVLHAGAESGSPTGVSSTLIVETSPVSNFASGVETLADVTGSTDGLEVTAENTQSGQGRWDLTRAERYIRFSVTNALTGGSAPTLIVGVSAFVGTGEL